MNAQHHGPHKRPPRCCRPDAELDAWLIRLSEQTGATVNQIMCEALALYRHIAAIPGGVTLQVQDTKKG